MLGQPIVQFKKRGGKAKANIRKRAATPPQASDSASDFSSSEDETGRRVKRRKRNTGAVIVSSKDRAPLGGDVSSTTIFKADRSLSLSASNDATSQSRLYAEGDSKKPAATRDEAPDGTYRGLANQTSFIQKNPDAPSRPTGPIKAPTNIRTVTFTDFAPDVCKDVSDSHLTTVYVSMQEQTLTLTFLVQTNRILWIVRYFPQVAQDDSN